MRRPAHNTNRLLRRRRTARAARRVPARRLAFEQLEPRWLLTAGPLADGPLADATAITFFHTPGRIDTAQASGNIAQVNSVVAYSVQLTAGDEVSAEVDAQSIGSPLDGLLTVDNSAGDAIASDDNYLGKDPALSFQAPTTGTYYLVVQSSPNSTDGPTYGLFNLKLSRTSESLLSDLVASSFSVSSPGIVITPNSAAVATWGSTVAVSYTVQNRGAAPAGAFDAQLLLSADNQFDSSPLVLKTVGVGALTSGGSTSGTISVTLPAISPTGYPASGEVYLGIRLDSNAAVVERTGPDNVGHRIGADSSGVTMLTAVVAPSGKAGSLATAQPIDLNSQVSGKAAPTGPQFIRIAIPTAGQLNVQIGSGSQATRVSLLSSDGVAIVQSDGQNALLPSDAITHDFDASTAGTYYLEVQTLSGKATPYVLDNEFVASAASLDTMPLSSVTNTMLSADFNGDGIPDLVFSSAFSPDATILLGIGDGTFQPPIQVPMALPGTSIAGMVVGDFNGDGTADIAVTLDDTSGTGGTVAVRLGRGDGTFGPLETYGNFDEPLAIVAGDFNGDGKLDLAVGELSDVAILYGNGQGAFAERTDPTGTPVRYPLGNQGAANGPASMVVGDFNNDGYLDLATANYYSADVSVLYGNADGSFSAPTVLSPYVDPDNKQADPQRSIATADFDGNGYLDLAIICPSDFGSDTVELFMGSAAGFTPGDLLQVPGHASQAVVGELGGTGQWDLAVAQATGAAPDNSESDKPFVTVLFNQGNQSFSSATTFDVSGNSNVIVPIDLDDDGRVDLVVSAATDGPWTSQSTGTLNVLMGNGSSSFTQIGSGFYAGELPDQVVTGDFNGDGIPDVAELDFGDNNVSVLFGRASGTYAPPVILNIPMGPHDFPAAIVAGDFNGDGRTDLAVAIDTSKNGSDSDEGEIAILLGQANGTFREAEEPSGQPLRYDSGGLDPVQLAIGNFFGGKDPDLAVINNPHTGGSGTNLSLLENDGSGGFGPPKSYPLGIAAGYSTMVVGDFNGDGLSDVAFTHDTNQISLLLSQGGGPFVESTVPLQNMGSDDIGQLAAGPFHAAGITDLAFTLSGSTSVVILDNDGHGDFLQQPVATSGIAGSPDVLAAAHVEADSLLDDLILAASPGGSLYNPGVVAVLSPLAGGQLALAGSFTTGRDPDTIAVADLNGDGLDDLVIGARYDDEIFPEISLGNGSFVDPSTASQPAQAPLLADLVGNGTPDSISLNVDGTILYRPGTPGQPAVFGSPITVNPATPARDIEAIQTLQGAAIVAIGLDDSLRLYRLVGGKFVSTVIDAHVGTLATSLAVGDLNGDHLDDIVVLNSADHDVVIFDQRADGSFVWQQTIDVPGQPAVVRLAALTEGSPWLDIIVGDGLSDNITVLTNLGDGKFSGNAADQLHFSAYDSYGGALLSGPTQWIQPLGISDIIVTDMNGDGIPDLVVCSVGMNLISVLLGDGHGGFSNAIPYGDINGPTSLTAGDYSGNGYTDIAFVGSGQGADDSDAYTYVMAGNGTGALPSYTDVAYAGSAPMAVATVEQAAPSGQTPQYSLEVTGQDGDLLTLKGNGNGTFAPWGFANQHVAMSVANLTGKPGEQDFVYADQLLSQVVVQFGQKGPAQSLSGDETLLAPGAIKVADLNGDGIPDLIVADSQADEVLVYLGLGGGQFAPARVFPVGTDPVGLTVTGKQADGSFIPNLIPGSADPDVLVADEGSSDVYELIGTGTGDNWSLRETAIFKAGIGPVSTTVVPTLGPGGEPTGVADLVVTNSGSNNVYVLRSIGNGLFDDNNPLIFPTGADPQQSLVGNFDGHEDLVTVNAGSNNLSFFSNFLQAGTDAKAELISTGGSGPVAAVEGDFLFNGGDDLIVANSASNSYRLLVGDASGLSLASKQATGEDPSDLAAVFNSSQGDFQIFGVGQSANVASLLFVFGPTAIAAGSTISQSGTESGVQVNLAALLSSTLAVVAALLAPPDSPLELESTSGLRPTTAASASSVAVAFVTANGDPFDTGAGVMGEAADYEIDAQGVFEPTAAELQLFNFLLEIEQSLEKNHRELLNQLLGARSSPMIWWLRGLAGPTDRIFQYWPGYQHGPGKQSTATEAVIDAAMQSAGAVQSADNGGGAMPQRRAFDLDADARFTEAAVAQSRAAGAQ